MNCSKQISPETRAFSFRPVVVNTSTQTRPAYIWRFNKVSTDWQQKLSTNFAKPFYDKLQFAGIGGLVYLLNQILLGWIKKMC